MFRRKGFKLKVPEVFKVPDRGYTWCFRFLFCTFDAEGSVFGAVCSYLQVFEVHGSCWGFTWACFLPFGLNQDVRYLFYLFRCSVLHFSSTFLGVCLKSLISIFAANFIRHEYWISVEWVSLSFEPSLLSLQMSPLKQRLYALLGIRVSFSRFKHLQQNKVLFKGSQSKRLWGTLGSSRHTSKWNSRVSRRFCRRHYF